MCTGNPLNERPSKQILFRASWTTPLGSVLSANVQQGLDVDWDRQVMDDPVPDVPDGANKRHTSGALKRLLDRLLNRHLRTNQDPLKARNVTIMKVGLLSLYQSPAAFDHDVPDIRDLVTKRLKGGGHVGLF